MGTWHKNCRMTKVKGKHQHVQIPNVLGEQTGCRLLPDGVEPSSCDVDVDLDDSNDEDCEPSEDDDCDDDEDSQADDLKEENDRAEMATLLQSAKKRNRRDGDEANDDDGISGDLKPIAKKPKRRTPSKASKAKNHWHLHFAEKIEHDEDESHCHWKCKRCGSKLKTTSCFTSSPVMNHLRRVHKITKDNAAEKIAGAGDDVVDGATSMKQQKLSLKKLKTAVSFPGKTNMMANMMIKDLCPVGTSNKEGFRELLGHLAPGIRTPDRSTIRRLIIKKAEFAKAEAKKHFESIDVKTHITTDCWSDKRNRSFGSFSVSCIDSDFKLMNLPCDVSLVKGRHTAQNLASWLQCEIDEFGLDVLTATTDSASNQVKAATLCIEKGHFSARLACVAHTLNLVIRQVLDDKDIDVNSAEEVDRDCDMEDEFSAISDQEERLDQVEDSDDEGSEPGKVSALLKRVRKLVVLFRRSNNCADALKKAQQNARNDQTDGWDRKEMSLLMDCKTRWSSAFIMLRRAVLLRRFTVTSKGMLHQHLSKKQRSVFLSDDEWHLAEEMETLLAPFYVVTNRLSGNAFTSSASVAHLWRRMIQTLENAKSVNDFHCSDDLVDRLVSSLKFHWKKHLASEVWLTASTLDPTQKKLRFLNKQERNVAWTALEFEVAAAIERREEREKEEAKKKKIGPSDAVDNTGRKQQDKAADLLCTLDGSSSDEEDAFSASAQVQRCKALKVATGKGDDFDVLGFSKDHRTQFPDLAEVARSHLGINSTSAGSERVFSVCGHIVSGRKSMISSRYMCALLRCSEISKCPKLWRVVSEAEFN